MKLIINVYLGAYCIALRIYGTLDAVIVWFTKLLIHFLYISNKKLQAKENSLEEYTNKEIARLKKLSLASDKEQRETTAIMLIAALFVLFYLSMAIALKLIFKGSFGIILVKKNVHFIIFAILFMSWISISIMYYNCNLDKEMKRFRRLSHKTQNRYIKYFLICSALILLIFKMADAFLCSR